MRIWEIIHWAPPGSWLNPVPCGNRAEVVSLSAGSCFLLPMTSLWSLLVALHLEPASVSKPFDTWDFSDFLLCCISYSSSREEFSASRTDMITRGPFRWSKIVFWLYGQWISKLCCIHWDILSVWQYRVTIVTQRSEDYKNQNSAHLMLDEYNIKDEEEMIFKEKFLESCHNSEY